MPRKPPSGRPSKRRPRAESADRRTAGTVAELERALDGLLEEGIGSYDDLSESGRRRMLELNAGFAAGEALLAGRGEAAARTGQGRVEALAGVIRYILHWAGEERTLDEPRETLAAMRAARKALERASRPAGADSRSPHQRRRGGAA